MQRKKEIPISPRFDYVTKKAYNLLYHFLSTDLLTTVYEQIYKFFVIPMKNEYLKIFRKN